MSEIKNELKQPSLQDEELLGEVMTSSKNNILLTEEAVGPFLIPISKENPQGEFLKYTPLYDQIQEARRFEDARLSQGVWQTAYKKSDWPLVESLCEEALKTQSKDLQLTGWLIEAWAGQIGLRGLRRGLVLLSELVKTFWPILYPQPEGPPDELDYEYRIRILEWLDGALSQRLLYVSLTSNPSNRRWLNLSHWTDALQLEKTIQRSPDKAKVLAKAATEKQITTTFFNQELSQTESSFLNKIVKDAEDCHQKINNLVKLIDSLSYKQCPIFKKTIERLQDIRGITLTAWEEQQQKLKKSATDLEKSPLDSASRQNEKEGNFQSFSGQEILKNRKLAYEKLQDLTTQLEQVDPQGVVPLFLRQALKWKGLTLIELLQTYGQTPEKLAALVSLFGAPSSIEKPSITPTFTASEPSFPSLTTQPASAAPAQSYPPSFQLPQLKR